MGAEEFAAGVAAGSCELVVVEFALTKLVATEREDTLEADSDVLLNIVAVEGGGRRAT